MKPNRNSLSLLAAVAFCASSTYAAHAEPITYTFTAEGPITGTLGGVAIGGMTGDLPTDVITFTFVSDTSDVQPFTLGPVHGFENLVGTASITVTDYSTQAVVAQGAFLPSDGIFVSIDNVNGGVGFGSDGASPSDPSFPGNPAYPFALVPDDEPAVFTYDLQSNIAFNSLSSLSCLGFPGACNAPTALATTAGLSRSGRGRRSVRRGGYRRIHRKRDIEHNTGSGAGHLGFDGDWTCCARLQAPQRATVVLSNRVGGAPAAISPLG